MSNALTGITNYNISNDLKSITDIKSGSNLTKKDNSLRCFKELYQEKIYSNGKINENKLNKQEKKLYSTCVEMESLLWKQVLNSMKKTINKYKLLDGGQGEEIFTDFLYDEYSSMMAKNSATGISVELYKQLSGQ